MIIAHPGIRKLKHTNLGNVTVICEEKKISHQINCYDSQIMNIPIFIS